MPRYCIRTEGDRENFEAADAAEAEEYARDYMLGVLGAEWNWEKYASTIFHKGYLFEIDEEGDDVADLGRIVVACDPPEPGCEFAPYDGDVQYGRGKHDWRHYSGPVGHGGGVISKDRCAQCGMHRVFDSWAQDPETGEQGYDSIAYEEGDAAWDFSEEA